MRSEGVFDPAQLEQQIADLQTAASDPDLWSDPNKAHTVLQKLARLQAEADGWKTLEDNLQTTAELVALTDGADAGMLAELAVEVDQLSRLVDEREIALLLSGPYDGHAAFL